MSMASANEERRREVMSELSDLMNTHSSMTAEMRAMNTKIGELKKEAEALLVPQEPGEGSVITFVKKNDKARMGRRIGVNEHSYAYAAISVNGLWFLTGEKTSGMSWKNLLEFITITEASPVVIELHRIGWASDPVEAIPLSRDRDGTYSW